MELLETILTNTYTKEDLQHRLTLLREFMEYQFFKPHEKTNVVYLLNEFIDQKKESRDEFNALNAWDYPFYSRFNKENVYENLKEIEKEAEKLPVITIYLPFNLPIFEAPKLGKWLRANIDPKILAEIKSDPSLIGGCSLVYKGEYRDLSLRFYIEKHKEAIRKVLESYLERKEGVAAQARAKSTAA